MAQLRAMFLAFEADSIPRILAGDFNSTPLSPERWLVKGELEDSWQPFRDGWATTFSLRSIGFPWGSVKIDAIFHDPVLESRGLWVAAQGASDHRPVAADLAPKKRKGERGADRNAGT
jgi:endonuclease/exonuclease/phosphatase family metal-dependent hydrolase